MLKVAAPVLAAEKYERYLVSAGSRNRMDSRQSAQRQHELTFLQQRHPSAPSTSSDYIAELGKNRNMNHLNRCLNNSRFYDPSINLGENNVGCGPAMALTSEFSLLHHLSQIPKDPYLQLENPIWSTKYPPTIAITTSPCTIGSRSSCDFSLAKLAPHHIKLEHYRTRAGNILLTLTSTTTKASTFVNNIRCRHHHTITLRPLDRIILGQGQVPLCYIVKYPRRITT